MPEFITVKAAYGKELLSEKEVLQHYLDGKDFMILSFSHGAGSYLNILDCERASNPISLEVRFGKKSQKVTLLDTTNTEVLKGKLEKKQKLGKKKEKEMSNTEKNPESLFNLTPAEAIQKGICISCEKPIFYCASRKAEKEGHIYSVAGQNEYRMTAFCEYCFDKAFEVPDDYEIDLDQREVEETNQWENKQ